MLAMKLTIVPKVFLVLSVCTILFPRVTTNFLFQEKKNWITEIRSKLLYGYNPSARPVRDHNSNTTVKFAVSLNSIDLDDHLQRFTAITFLLITWKDEFLQWNPKDYGEVESIHFDKDEVWMPDIALFNSAKSLNVAPSSTLPVLSYSDGMMMWVPPFSAEVPCQIDIGVWPSDIHTCVLRFGSWAHHGEQIDIQMVEDNPISVEFYEENKRWSILNMTATKESTTYKDEVYFHVDFKITVRREAASHASYVTQTTFGVMMVILGSYLLPLSYHLSRFLLHLFSLTILITSNFVMFLSLPATGGSIPHVVRYYSGAIILTTLSLLCNVVMATSMTTKSDGQRSIKRKLSSLFKEEGSAPQAEFDRREVIYSNLDEDAVEMSNNTSAPQSPQVPAARTEKDRVSTLKIHRILNVILLVMFSLAYIIDYAVMRKLIGH